MTFALILPEIVVFCCYKSSAPLSFTAIQCPPFIKTKIHLLFSSARAKMTKDLYGINSYGLVNICLCHRITQELSLDFFQ